MYIKFTSLLLVCSVNFLLQIWNIVTNAPMEQWDVFALIRIYTFCSFGTALSMNKTEAVELEVTSTSYSIRQH